MKKKTVLTLFRTELIFADYNVLYDLIGIIGGHVGVPNKSCISFLLNFVWVDPKKF